MIWTDETNLLVVVVVVVVAAIVIVLRLIEPLQAP